MSTPDDILRDALAKIRCSLGADITRLGQIRAEEMELNAQVAKGEVAERVLLAAMGDGPALVIEQPAVPAPAEPASPDPEEPVAAPKAPAVRLDGLRPDGPQAAAEAIATVAGAPEPRAAAGTPLPVADPGRDAAIRAAKALSPETRSERHVRILAAAGVVRAMGTQAQATALRFAVHGAELAPSMLRKIGIVEEDVVAVAKAIAPKKGAPEPAASEPEEPAPTDPGATIRDFADDLLDDLPTMLATSPHGISAAVIADWLGCTEQQAREAAALLIQEGKARAENRLLRLPAGEAVTA